MGYWYLVPTWFASIFWHTNTYSISQMFAVERELGNGSYEVSFLVVLSRPTPKNTHQFSHSGWHDSITWRWLITEDAIVHGNETNNKKNKGGRSEEEAGRTIVVDKKKFTKKCEIMVEHGIHFFSSWMICTAADVAISCVVADYSP